MLFPAWRVREAFAPRVLARIEQAIAASERHHRGEIRFVVEGALDVPALWRLRDVRARALEVFAQLGVWDTEHNNGVLVYLLLAERDVEIMADRGIAKQVPETEWERICRLMEAEFRQGRFEHGVLLGIEAIDVHLRQWFPLEGAEPNLNEQADRPVVL